MHLQRIKLEHIRLFESDEIEFAHQDGSPRMFTVIIAENGQAKTTLLQAIALAAAGVGGGNKLVHAGRSCLGVSVARSLHPPLADSRVCPFPRLEAARGRGHSLSLAALDEATAARR